MSRIQQILQAIIIIKIFHGYHCRRMPYSSNKGFNLQHLFKFDLNNCWFIACEYRIQ
uniref:Candidate secreted effector n=1 Tax=Meloidogyne incognita TaxID=6306 RepID=A0A914LYT6_MELIC